MNRTHEIRQRLAAIDYRSHVDAVFAADIKYLLGLVDTFEQVRDELNDVWQARVSILESVNNSLTDRNAAIEAENSELKARFLDVITDPPASQPATGEEEAGQASGVDETAPGSEAPAAGSDEPAPVDGGAASGVEP